ncbi:MAG: hypothetical protein KA004_11960 [Verrucomicrobiales bacterium]|nr:hypothetical protein [Verrucomicrobiales bacterium]
MTRFHPLIALLAIGWCAAAWPQEANTRDQPGRDRLAMLLENKKALDVSRTTLAEKEKRLAVLKSGRENGKELQPKPLPEEIASAEKEVADARRVLEQRESDLRASALGVAGLDGDEPEEIDLDREVKEVIVKPLVGMAKDLVARQRQVAELKTQISRKERLAARYDLAIENVQTMQEAMKDSAKDAKQKEMRDFLDGLQKEIATSRSRVPVDIANLKRQVESLEADRKPLGEYATGLLRDTVMRRVLNLLLAAGAFIGVLLLFRLLHRLLLGKMRTRRMGATPFLLRLADVLYHVFSMAAAGMVTFLVLYASDDWFLMTLAMLVLAGLLLAGRHTLPKLYEQAKLLLNIGTAREGERILYRDLPWLLRRIHIYCELVNPSLTGGVLRIALRDLIPLNSRPFDRKELWFPTSEGDWVILDDGMLGKVITQTPEYVQVLPNGGSYKTYRTAAFLAQNPRNLSYNFRITSIFGLDYGHLDQLLNEIPQLLQQQLVIDLRKALGPEELIGVAVELGHAGASSLDFSILADFKGSAASRYQELQRLIQRSCTATAAARGWTIAFPQMVIHQAKEHPGNIQALPLS